MTRKQFIPAEVQQLMELGKEGKLWSLWVLYNVHNPAKPQNETRLWKLQNLVAAEVKKHRESMFRYGFTIPLESGHWKIICPMDIIEVDLFKQGGYMPQIDGDPHYGID